MQRSGGTLAERGAKRGAIAGGGDQRDLSAGDGETSEGASRATGAAPKDATGQTVSGKAQGGILHDIGQFLGRVTKFKSSEKPWTAYLVLPFLAVAGVLIGLTMSFHPAASIIGRLFQVIMPSAFVGLAANFAARDFTTDSPKKTPATGSAQAPAREAPGKGIDKTPVDRWSWVHHLAGWVLGLLGASLPIVMGVTVAWELFEMSAAKFGMDEINANRITDITLAWGGWFLARLVLAIH
jgi:hypothetical protein